MLWYLGCGQEDKEGNRFQCLKIRNQSSFKKINYILGFLTLKTANLSAYSKTEVYVTVSYKLPAPAAAEQVLRSSRQCDFPEKQGFGNTFR